MAIAGVFSAYSLKAPFFSKIDCALIRTVVTPQATKMSEQRRALITAFFGSDPYPTPLSPPRVIHELPAPVVTFDGKTHTITIFRKDGTWLNNFFTENSLSVGSCRTDDLSSLNLSPYQLEQIKMAADGLIYYLRAQDNNVNFTEFILLESKEEADAVAKAIQEAD